MIQQTIPNQKANYMQTIHYLNSNNTHTIAYKQYHITTDINREPKEFMDDIRGAGLNDTTIKEVKTILIQYINRLTGKWEDIEEREALRRKLSLPDTIIESKAVYDYLVDLFVVHNYDSKSV